MLVNIGQVKDEIPLNWVQKKSLKMQKNQKSLK